MPAMILSSDFAYQRISIKYFIVSEIKHSKYFSAIEILWRK